MKYDSKIAQFEKEGKFNEDVAIPNPKYYRVPDSDFSYDSNALEKIFSVLIRFICKTLGPIFLFIVYDFRVKGRKNLKGIKTGAITICNHVSPFDSPLMVREAVFGKKLYCTMAPTNNKIGFFGAVLKAGGGIPFGTTLKNQKDISLLFKKILKKKGYINFHPEHGYWPYYQKPRPMFHGAFYYAIKNGVSVIPMFICFRKGKFIRRNHITLFIDKPIYPNNDLDIKENEIIMMEKAKESWDNIYSSFYNKI